MSKEWPKAGAHPGKDQSTMCPCEVWRLKGKEMLERIQKDKINLVERGRESLYGGEEVRGQLGASFPQPLSGLFFFF